MHDHQNPHLTSIHRQTKCLVLCLLVLGLAMALYFIPALPQSLQYHFFADDKVYLGIKNAFNVMSNIPFLLIGLCGLVHSINNKQQDRLFYAVFFTGVFAVFWGSSYYHWHPSNDRLVWDRFAISVALMGFLCAIISERFSLKLAKYLIIPFLLLAVSSVLYWHYTESLNRGDLIFYIFMQSFPMLVIPYLLLLFPAKYSAVRYIWLALGGYLLSRVCELYDQPIYDFFHQWLSGHTMKHLLAGLATYCIYIYLKHRQKIS